MFFEGPVILNPSFNEWVYFRNVKPVGFPGLALAWNPTRKKEPGLKL